MKVLVVVDMQNDFITGSLGTPEAQAIVPNVKKKIEEYRNNGDLIVFTRDTHQPDYLLTKEGVKLPVEHCIMDAWGWKITDELHDEAANAVIVDKPTFGSVDLCDAIASLEADCEPTDVVEEIELVGLCTDICVTSNAMILKAVFYDTIDISVDATCCAGVTPETHEAALKTMEMCQINVKRG